MSKDLKIILSQQDEATITTAGVVAIDLFGAAEQFVNIAEGLVADLEGIRDGGVTRHAQGLNTLDRSTIDALVVTRDVVTKFVKRATLLDAVTVLSIESAFNDIIVKFQHRLEEDKQRRAREQQIIDDVLSSESDNDEGAKVNAPKLVELTEDELLEVLRGPMGRTVSQ